jgi:CreA protein
MIRTLATACALAALSSAVALAEEVGSVDTTFRIVGPNDKIVVEVFEDPGVKGVSCYLSRARAGGLNPFAEDKSDSSVACRQISPEVSFPHPLPRQEKIFSEKASFLFKHVHVVRMVDSARNVLVYLVYSDKLVDGSPKNSVTAVPISKETPIPVKK